MMSQNPYKAFLASQKIAAEEDNRILKLLEQLGRIRCEDKSHLAYDKLIETCDQSECVVKHVLQS